GGAGARGGAGVLGGAPGFGSGRRDRRAGRDAGLTLPTAGLPRATRSRGCRGEYRPGCQRVSQRRARGDGRARQPGKRMDREPPCSFRPLRRGGPSGVWHRVLHAGLRGGSGLGRGPVRRAAGSTMSLLARITLVVLMFDALALAAVELLYLPLRVGAVPFPIT